MRWNIKAALEGHDEDNKVWLDTQQIGLKMIQILKKDCKDK